MAFYLMNSRAISRLGAAEEVQLPRRPTYHTPVDDKTVGQRVRQLRKKRGLSQTEVADKLGVHQSLVSEYELGTVRIPAPVLAAFGQLLRTSLDQMVGLKPIKENGLFEDRRFIRRLEKIEKLPKRAKQTLLKTIDAYLVGIEKR
jgi:transcriptional regulator with XRE-family HTH domain